MIKNYFLLKNNYFLLLLFISLFSFGQIQQRGTATSASGEITNNGVNPSFTINKPAGVQIGDIMIVTIAQEESSNQVNPNSPGWTLISGADIEGGGDHAWGAVLYKIATAADVSTANFTFILGRRPYQYVAAMVAFSGVDTANPIDATGSIVKNNDDDESRTSAITTTSPNAAVLMFGMSEDDIRWSNWRTTNPGSLTELFDFQQDSKASVGAAWAIKSATGSTGQGIVDLNDDEDKTGTLLLALRACAVPSTPTNIRGDNVSCNGYVARWDGSATNFYIDVATANTFNSGTIVASYNNTNVGSGNNVSLTGLAPGTTYYFRVRAYNSCGFSNYSSVGNFTTLAVATPTNVRADNPSCNGFVARWDGNNAIRYFLDVATTNTFNAGSIVPAYNNSNVGNVNDITLSGLSPNTTYYFRVRREDACGVSANSAVANYNTSPTTVAPNNIRTDSYSTCDGFVARWDQFGATEFFIDVATDNTFSPSSIVPIYNNLNVGNVKNITLTGLSPNINYYFRVRANGSCGLSNNSSVSIPQMTRGTASATIGTITHPTCSTSTGSFTITNYNSSYNYTFSPSSGVTRTGNSVTANPGTYTITVTGGGCTSTATNFTINTPTSTTAAPTADAFQSFCASTSPTVANLTASGTAVKWYATASGGSALASSALLVNGIHYYATQTVGGCESSTRLDVLVTLAPAATITPNKVNETCTISNNGSISPVFSGGLTNVRYIKLTQKYVNADAWQQVQEIQAFEIFTGTNVALASNGATATSSSDYLNNTGTYGPLKAIDGIFAGSNFWHSNSTSTGEFIRVDLTSAKNLDYLRIYNRSDCCWERGQNMLLELFDASNNLVYSKTVNLWGGINGANYIDVNILDVSWTDGATTLNRTALDSGNYTLNYSDAAGCPASSTINISTINTDSTNPTGITGTTIICNGNSTTLTVSGGTLGTGATVRWYSGSCGGTSIGSGNSITVSPTTSTTYYVRYEGTCNTTTCVSQLVTVNAVLANNSLSYTNGTSGQLNATPAEGANATLNAPAGTYFTTVNFASYGTPNGTSPNFAIGSCHSTTSQSVTEGYLLGNNSAIIPATNGVFGDPCNGTVKRLYVLASYAQPVCNGSTVTISGATPTGGTGTYTYQWESSTTSATSGFTAAAGTNNGINYTSAALTQTTWFRRVVTSCTYSSVSAVVMVRVNAVVTAGAIASTGQTICYNTVPTLNIGNTTGPGGGDSNYVYQWQYSTNSTFASGTTTVVSNTPTYTPTQTLTQTTYYRRQVKDVTCNSYITSSNVWTVTVNPLSVGGTVSGSTAVCTGTNSTTLTLSGHTGNVLRWESSLNNFATAGTTIANTTTTLTVTNLTAATSYRAVLQSGVCTTANSAVAAITVNPAPSTPVIGTITHPSCAVSTGSVALSGLPATGSVIQTGHANATYAITGGGVQTITGLASGTYNFTVSNGSCTSAATINAVINNPPGTNTWTGSWSNGIPTIEQRIIFNADYSSSTNVDACSCQVNNADVVFNSGHTLKVVNDVDVKTNGSLTFENNASLVQINDGAVNSGDINYKRHTAPVKRYDFTYWSSPVAGQTMKALSPNTLGDKYYSYNPNTGWKIEYNGALTMLAGNGYIIRAPQTFSITVAAIDTNPMFVGKPNNGVVTLPSLAGSRVHLLGNPYPSTLNADAFLDLNSAVLEGTLYFWTHNSAPSNAVAGDATYNYTTNDYATYNRTGGVGTGTAATTGALVPTGEIATGQAFFAPAKATGDVIFNNSMRLSATGTLLTNSQFFKVNTNSKTSTATALTEKNRVWLNLTNTQGAFKQTLVGYITGATNNYDGGFDGITYDGNAFVDFYSVNNAVNLSIQGRAVPFVKQDSVALGYKSTIKGDFTISIDHTDGVLTTQNIFLEDKDLKVLHDLKKEAYTFSTEKGAFNNRFVLRYVDKNAVEEVIVPEVPEEILDKEIIVAVKNKEITINSPVELLDKIVVYDVAGRKLFQKNKVDANVFVVNHFISSHQMLVITVQLSNGKKWSRKIMY